MAEVQWIKEASEGKDSCHQGKGKTLKKCGLLMANTKVPKKQDCLFCFANCVFPNRLRFLD